MQGCRPHQVLDCALFRHPARTARIDAGAAALTPLWLPAVAGGLLGCLASAAGVVGARRLWRAPSAPLRVVITGGSSGIGKAMAREFLRRGERSAPQRPMLGPAVGLRKAGCPAARVASKHGAQQGTALPSWPSRLQKRQERCWAPRCRCGDRVLVTSRSEAGAQAAAQQLRQEVGPAVDVQGGPRFGT